MTRSLARYFLTAAFSLALTLFAFAQDQVKWSAEVFPPDARAGESAQIIISAEIEEGWHLYSKVKVEGGPHPTTITVRDAPNFLEVNGEVVEPKPIKKEDPNFGLVVGFFDKQAKFAIPVTLLNDARGDRHRGTA